MTEIKQDMGRLKQDQEVGTKFLTEKIVLVEKRLQQQIDNVMQQTRDISSAMSTVVDHVAKLPNEMRNVMDTWGTIRFGPVRGTPTTVSGKDFQNNVLDWIHQQTAEQKGVVAEEVPKVEHVEPDAPFEINQWVAYPPSTQPKGEAANGNEDGSGSAQVVVKIEDGHPDSEVQVNITVQAKDDGEPMMIDDVTAVIPEEHHLERDEHHPEHVEHHPEPNKHLERDEHNPTHDETSMVVDKARPDTTEDVAEDPCRVNMEIASSDNQDLSSTGHMQHNPLEPSNLPTAPTILITSATPNGSQENEKARISSGETGGPSVVHEPIATQHPGDVRGGATSADDNRSDVSRHSPASVPDIPHQPLSSGIPLPIPVGAPIVEGNAESQMAAESLEHANAPPNTEGPRLEVGPSQPIAPVVNHTLLPPPPSTLACPMMTRARSKSASQPSPPKEQSVTLKPASKNQKKGHKPSSKKS